MTQPERDPEEWYLYSAAGAHRFMVELHERGVPPEQAAEMMRNYGRRFVEEADQQTSEAAEHDF